MWNKENGMDWEKEKLSNGWTPSSQEFSVVRRVYQQDKLNKDADYQKPTTTLGQRCKNLLQQCGFGECLRNSVPIIHWLPKYKKEYIVGDLIAGATTAVLQIPQGMAYALLANCPPIVGLYMAFFPIFIYIILGNSPHVSLGTFAVAMLMAGKVVLDHATVPDQSVGPYDPIQVLCALSFLIGIIQLVMWCLRLGALSSLLSEQLVSGLTTGASFHVAASQLKDLFGIKLPKIPNDFKVIRTIVEVARRVPESNIAAFIVAFISCLVLALSNEFFKPWLSKRTKIPCPMELIVIVVSTLASTYMNLKGVYNVATIGNIPTGLPPPTLPPFELFQSIIVDAITITMVTYTITLSMGLIFASREKYEIDANQELLGMGASNIFGSFFSCGPICASLSRSYLQYTAGCKTLMTSLISALLILLVLLWIGPFFEALPRCVLASIVVVSLKGLFMQVKDLKRFWNLCKLDAAVWLVTFLVTVLFNVSIGLAAGLAASIGALFFVSQNPYTCLLGNVKNTDLYVDMKRYRAADEVPGIKIFHYCGGLNFASKNLFRAKLYRKIGYLRPTETNSQTIDHHPLTSAASYVWDPAVGKMVQCVILDASALSYVDAPGIKTLKGIQNDFASSDIRLLLAGANGPVQEMIERFNSLEKDRFHLPMFPTVHDAVTYYTAHETKARDANLTITTS